MQAIQFVRDQLKQNREFLEGTLADVSDAEAHAAPPGILNPIASTYAHLVAGEDGFVNGLLRGGAPLFATSWAGRTGLCEPPPEGLEWGDWGRRVKIDLCQLREYSAAVAASTDEWLATLTSDDLDKTLDLSSFGFGERSLGWVLGSAVIGHVQAHWGEICALKGLYGGKGFPV
jgi:hypothetical protein